MKTLLDTNILARYLEAGATQHQAAVESVAVLRERGHEICLVPQNLYELWVVCTRPVGQNGFGMTSQQAESELVRLKKVCLFLDDNPQLFVEWEQLVTRHQVIGKNGHDARLVAAMKIHAIPRLLTFNEQDFKRYPDIEVLTPGAVLGEAARPE